MTGLILASSSGVDQTNTIFTILASAIIVLGGIGALVRIIWKTANLLRDTTNAAKSLASKYEDLHAQMDKLTERVAAIESRKQP